jgi:hypothetical protein
MRSSDAFVNSRETGVRMSVHEEEEEKNGK